MDTLIQIQYSALNSVAILHISGIISSYELIERSIFISSLRTWSMKPD